MPVPNEPKGPVQGRENTAAEQQKNRENGQVAREGEDAPQGK